MIGRLNHVGVAVPSIEAAKDTYRTLYGVADSDITETRDMPAPRHSTRSLLQRKI